MSGIGLTPGGQAAYTAGLSAKAPLPTSEFGASPRGTTVNIDVEGPSSPSRGQTPKAMSYASDRRGSPPEGPSVSDYPVFRRSISGLRHASVAQRWFACA